MECVAFSRCELSIVKASTIQLHVLQCEKFLGDFSYSSLYQMTNTIIYSRLYSSNDIITEIFERVILLSESKFVAIFITLTCSKTNITEDEVSPNCSYTMNEFRSSSIFSSGLFFHFSCKVKKQ